MTGRLKHETLRSSVEGPTRSSGPRFCADRSGSVEIRTSERGSAPKTKSRYQRYQLFVFLSTRRDSNPRPSPWQGDTPPLSHSCMFLVFQPNNMYYTDAVFICQQLFLFFLSFSKKGRTIIFLPGSSFYLF